MKKVFLILLTVFYFNTILSAQNKQTFNTTTATTMGNSITPMTSLPIMGDSTIKTTPILALNGFDKIAKFDLAGLSSLTKIT